MINKKDNKQKKSNTGNVYNQFMKIDNVKCTYLFIDEPDVEYDNKYLRPEELNDLKGDSTKLRDLTGWKPKYTFESMLDEMVEYWLEHFNKQ